MPKIKQISKKSPTLASLPSATERLYSIIGEFGAHLSVGIKYGVPLNPQTQIYTN